jgi:hypothetical protein
VLKYIALTFGLLLLLPTGVRAAETDPCQALANVQPNDDVAPARPGAKTTPKKIKKDKSTGKLVPLALVICEVEQALDDYQGVVTQPLKPETDDLPKLATADFDFKTVADDKLTGGIGFYIFKLGASRDKQSTNDMDFTYEPKSRHKPQTVEGFEKVEPFQKKLVDTIKAAAKAIKDQQGIPSTVKDPLVLKQLTVTVGYGVTWDVNGGVTVPIDIVTLTGTYDHSKNTVQTVKLTFADPTPDSKKPDSKN